MMKDDEESQDEGLAKRPAKANDTSTKESRKGKIPSEKVSEREKGQKDLLRRENLCRALRPNVNNMA